MEHGGREQQRIAKDEKSEPAKIAKLENAGLGVQQQVLRLRRKEGWMMSVSGLGPWEPAIIMELNLDITVAYSLGMYIGKRTAQLIDIKLDVTTGSKHSIAH